MQPKISVIVPVYKAETYIHHCIDSILAQTFTDFELILVNDGSPDSSGIICNEYAQRDSRIKVIHKENGGVASARQCGIDAATGIYTIHTDPDDWISNNMLEELYYKAIEANADMVVCDYYLYKNKKDYYISQTPKSLETPELLKLYLGQKLHGSLCNKLIKKELYTKYNIRLPKNIIRWEDLFVVCSILTKTVKVAYLAKAFYHYDQTINPHSIVRKTTMKGLQSQILFVEHFMKILSEEDFGKELYTIKASTKELAYNCGLLKDEEIIELYKEINAEYIKSAKIGNIFKFSFSLFLNEKLSYKNSKRLLSVLTFIRNIRNCLANIVKKIISYKQ